MSDSKEIAVAEQPQQLITIEPTKYVELVFEPFAKQYADAVDAVRTVAYDIKTTAGMAVAIKHRAVFRDIRVASEKARKLRKAPILEIGKLLDSRQDEIESTLLPLETMFDEEIKAEEQRKDAEKIAKAVSESARISLVRKMIDEIKAIPAESVGRSSADLAATIELLEMHEITPAEFFEFSGEAEVAKHASLARLREMQTAQVAVEAEAARIAAEREQLARERAEAEERERVAAQARAEQEAKDRAQRERVEAEQRAAQEKAAEAMRQQQAEHEARMRAQQEEIDRQQAEIDRVKAEQERIERERLEAIEAEARAKREAEEAAARAEAERIAAAERAKEAERLRRLRVEFEENGPGDLAIVEAIANRFEVSEEVAARWLAKFDATSFLTPTQQAA